MNFLVKSCGLFVRKQLAIKESLSDLPDSLVTIIGGYAENIMNHEVQQEVNVRFAHFKLFTMYNFTHRVVRSEPDGGQSYLQCTMYPEIRRTFHVWHRGITVERTNRFGHPIGWNGHYQQTVKDCKTWWEMAYLEEQAARRRKIYERVTGRAFDERLLPIHRDIFSIRWADYCMDPEHPDWLDYFWNFLDQGRRRQLKMIPIGW